MPERESLMYAKIELSLLSAMKGSGCLLFNSSSISGFKTVGKQPDYSIAYNPSQARILEEMIDKKILGPDSTSSKSAGLAVDEGTSAAGLPFSPHTILC